MILQPGGKVFFERGLAREEGRGLAALILQAFWGRDHGYVLCSSITRSPGHCSNSSRKKNKRADWEDAQR